MAATKSRVNQRLSSLGYFEMDLQSSRLTWSDGLYTIYGMDPNVFQPNLESFLALVHPEDRASMQRAVQAAIETRSGFRQLERIVRGDGEIRFLESRGSVECDAHGQPTYLIGACLDVTEMLQADVKLREGVEALRQAHSIAQLDSWTYSVANRTFRRFFEDWSGSESFPSSIGLSEEQWIELLHPEDREMVVQAWRETLSSGKPYEVEHRFVDQGVTRWVRVCAKAERGADGLVERVTGVTQDVTARLKLEEQLRESQKMEAIGRLAGGVAHDFNNFLTVIIGWSELLQAAPSEEIRQEAIEGIKEAGHKAASLTKQLLTFSRRTTGEPQVIDVNQMVRDFGRLIRRLVGKDIGLVECIEAQPALIRIDPNQFDQMLMNLVVNARDAMPGGGQLEIGTRRLGAFVELHVSDSGEGIEPELMTKIFEPFFTTKDLGSGTGLGLAVVHGVVTRWGGTIDLQSERNNGTSFRVRFPCLPEAVLSGPSPRNGDPAQGRETILLVEDEDHVRRIARIILENQGYRVLEAELPSRALELLEQHLDDIDLLLTDVTMPGMDGGKMADLIRTRRPDLPVLFMSGCTDEALNNLNVTKSPESFLQKPFSPETLTSTVRCLLSQARRSKGLVR